MKAALFVFAMFLGASAMAQDACLNTLEKKYQGEAKNSHDWGYEGISSLTLKQAKSMIKDALPDDGEKARAQMQGLLRDKNVLFYTLQWNAPGNKGITMIAADSRNCAVLADLLFWSEE